MIEDIFTLAMRLQIERHHRSNAAALIPHRQVLWAPPRPLGGAARLLEAVEEIEGDEGVGGVLGVVRARVPSHAADLGDPAMNGDGGRLARHAVKPSKIRLSQWLSIASHSFGLRTVQAITGIPCLR